MYLDQLNETENCNINYNHIWYVNVFEYEAMISKTKSDSKEHGAKP